jgi:alkylation response protein AidB-like acyl-CoA dehydrogenase
MKFSYGDDQLALRDLARKVFDRHATPAALAAAGRDGFLEPLWRELGAAGLLGVALGEDAGGSGLGLVELGLVLGELGRAAALAAAPVWPSLVLGALAIERFGSAAQRARFLAGVASGEAILSAALADGPAGPVRARRSAAGGFSLDGERVCVPAAHLAARILVPTATEDGPGLFVLDPRAAGVELERQIATSGEPQFTLRLSGAPVAEDTRIATPGVDPALWIRERGEACLAAIACGVARRALEMTAAYATERRQFDRPIATFQAVAQRAADAFVDVEAMQVTALEALWRLDAGLPASREVAIAKFWAAEGGHRVTAAAQHLHGGMGFDRAYPLHRYTLAAKMLELTLGGAHEQLARLGALIAKAAASPEGKGSS